MVEYARHTHDLRRFVQQVIIDMLVKLSSNKFSSMAKQTCRGKVSSSHTKHVHVRQALEGRGFESRVHLLTIPLT